METEFLAFDRGLIVWGLTLVLTGLCYLMIFKSEMTQIKICGVFALFPLPYVFSILLETPVVVTVGTLLTTIGVVGAISFFAYVVSIKIYEDIM